MILLVGFIGNDLKVNSNYLIKIFARFIWHKDHDNSGFEIKKNFKVRYLKLKIVNRTKSNVINNYRYCFPCFAYLIKICYDKDRIVLKQRKLRLFFSFSFFLIKNFLLQCISKRLSSFAFLYHLHFVTVLCRL